MGWLESTPVCIVYGKQAEARCRFSEAIIQTMNAQMYVRMHHPGGDYLVVEQFRCLRQAEGHLPQEKH